jgi:hypothetical protein
MAQDSLNIPKYYKYVNESNALLSRYKYEEALQGFRNAFKQVKNPFFTDLNNALFAVSQSTQIDTKFAVSILEQIQNKGICIHERYKSIEGYSKFLSMISHQGCNKVCNSAREAELNRGMKLDQVLREFGRVEYGHVYHEDVFGGIRIIDSINSILVENVLNEALLKKINLEDYVGYNNVYHTFVILLHNGPWGRVDRDFLTKLVHQGILDARNIAYLFDELCNVDYRGEIFSNWAEDNHCEPNLNIFGTTKLWSNGDVFLMEIDTVSRAYKNVEAKRNSFFLPEMHEDAKVTAFAHYMKSKGMDYGRIRRMPLQVINNVIENIKREGKSYRLIKSVNDLNF